MIQPLRQQRVVITRAPHQSAELAQLLETQGAKILFCPVMAIGPPADAQPLRSAAAQCDRYDWIVFTSANAVAAFVAASRSKGWSPRVAAIGSATAKAAQAAGFTVDLMPDDHTSEGLVAAFQHHDLCGKKVLLPAAAVTRDILPGELQKMGAQVTVVEAYRNVIPSEAAACVAEIFRDPYPDWITFFSPSAVDHLLQLAEPGIVSRSQIATIGPVTSTAVRAAGLLVRAEARGQSTASLVEEICRVALSSAT